MTPGKLIDPDIAKAVHNLRTQNLSWSYIGNVFGHKKYWAYRVWTKYDAITGLPSVPKKGSRPRKTDPVSDEAVGKLAIALRRTTAKKISVTLKDAGIMAVSPSTICSRLREQKIRQARPVKDSLTSLHKANRVKWCEDRKADLFVNPLMFHRWLFSDEARFSLDDCGKAKVCCID